jgi:hypothetical protein
MRPYRTSPKLLLIVILTSFLLGAGVGCNDRGDAPTPEDANRPDPTKQASQPHRPDETSETNQQDDANDVGQASSRDREGPNETQPDPHAFDRRLREVLALEQDARFSHALRAAFEMQEDFRGHPREDELRDLVYRLREERDASGLLGFAMAKLLSEDPSEAGTARREFLEAGRAGVIYLRKVFREDNGRKAAAAVAVLRDARDANALPEIVDKLGLDPNALLREAITDALADWPGDVPAPVVSRIYRLVDFDDKQFEDRDLVAVLASIARKQADGDHEQFDTLAGTSDAFKSLRAYARRAARSSDEDVVVWATRHAATLGSYLPGLKGEYYKDKDFDKLAFRRIDQKLQFGMETYGYPTGRNEDISIRWTGFLRITESGTYVLHSESDDGQRVWVDGKQVIDNWTDQGPTEKSAELELSAGLHPIKIEYYQASGGGSYRFSWTTPDGRKTLVPPEAMATLPISTGQ